MTARTHATNRRQNADTARRVSPLHALSRPGESAPTAVPVPAPGSMTALAQYMKPADLVGFLDHTVTEGTLRNWRSDRNGPPYITIGRSVLYPTDAVIAWIEEKKQAAVRSWPRQT